MTKNAIGLRALSLFASAGVAETYFQKHGIIVKVASELLHERAALYQHLYPDTTMIEGDITDPAVFSSVMNAAKREQCNFIIATPPCQGMSTAGLQKKDDPRNRLIIQVVDAILTLKPRFVIIENVPAILQTKIEIDGKWTFIDEYLHMELDESYSFNKDKIVNAMYYGVAQSRERCVYLLTSKEYSWTWEFPAPSDNITTMRDVIGDLPSLDPEVTDITEDELLQLFPEYYKKKAAGEKISKWHYPPKHKYRHVIAMIHTPEGCSAWNNKKFYPTLADGTKGKGYPNTYKRQWWDKPAYTVTRYTSRIGSQENGHPGRAIIDSPDEETRIWSDPRVLSIFELMRVSSLPDDWNLPDGVSSNVVREILGEGIPPRLLEHAVIELERLLNG